VLWVGWPFFHRYGAAQCAHEATISIEPLQRNLVSVDCHNRKIGWRWSLGPAVHSDATLKSRDFLEVALTYALVLLAIWTTNPLQSWLSWIILAWVVAATAASGQDARTLGLRPVCLRRSLWIIGIATALAVWIATQVHIPYALPGGMLTVSRTMGYLTWAFSQQFLLQDFFLLRLLRLLSSKTAAVIIAAVLFATAHIPNPFLVVVTLLWGGVACALFLRYRNLYALGIAHGILGICLAVAVPNAVHHGMRVGLGYLHYHP